MSELNLFSEVVSSDNAQTISSIEIAEFANKMHKHVLDSIRSMEDSWENVTGTRFRLSEYKDKTGRMLPMYRLTKTESLYIASKFNDEVRARLIIRWEELERKQQQHQVPQSFSEALMLAAKQAKVIEDQQKQLEVQAPKVLFSDAVASSKSSCLIGELAKLISQNGFHIGQNRLFQWMRKNGYLGSFGNRYNIPMQQYIEQGLFEIKEGVRTDNDGVLHTTITTKVTGKGQVYFINKFLGGVVRL